LTKTLVDRTALVTGGSRGIGRAIALALANEGADVAVSSRTLPDLQKVASEIQESGQRSLAVACDVTDAEQVADLVDQVVESLGPIEILVNNAGASGSHKFIDHPDELWDRMLAINLTSVYRVSKAVVPQMVERKWGRVINVASVASKTPTRYASAYTASKHGVLGLTRAMALELNTFNITVNAICPAYVDTPMTDATIANSAERTGRSPEEILQIIEQGNPQGRLITPEEVAAVAVLLASDSSRGITSQAINVDGGEVLF
jgi:3-hydroxybutyrate dehydrogenase